MIRAASVRLVPRAAGGPGTPRHAEFPAQSESDYASDSESDRAGPGLRLRPAAQLTPGHGYRGPGLPSRRRRSRRRGLSESPPGAAGGAAVTGTVQVT